MKKENFVTLILSTVGGILFALGMCMALVEEWAALKQGIVMGTAGLVVLLIMVLVRRKMLHKPPVRFNAKTVGMVALVVVAALLLGVGMCMVLVWEGLMIPGVLVGLLGIVLLLCLIPICKGLK